MSFKSVRLDVPPTCAACSHPLNGVPSRHVDLKRLFLAARTLHPTSSVCQLCRERIDIINQERSSDVKEAYLLVCDQINSCVAVILALAVAAGMFFFPPHRI